MSSSSDGEDFDDALPDEIQLAQVGDALNEPGETGESSISPAKTAEEYEYDDDEIVAADGTVDTFDELEEAEKEAARLLGWDAGNWGGNFSGYFEALKHLGNSFVRFAPWFPYWQLRTH